MDNIAGTKSSLTWAVHISVVLLVALWLFPTLGLFVSSFRSADQISGSGWWISMFPAEQNLVIRAADPDDFRVERDGAFVVEGDLFEDGQSVEILAWGTSSRSIDAYTIGDVADHYG